MKMMIVDDEILAIEVLEILLNRIPGVEIVGKYTDPQQAYQEIGRLEVDVIFLDMEMGTIHGLQLAEDISMKCPHVEIVFVTAHSKFALEAFEVSAIDYLLKPVNFTRLCKTIEKLRERQKLAFQINQLPVANNARLSIQAMGSFKLYDATSNEVKWRTRKAKELFAYLWQHKKRVTTRSRIMEELWGDLPEDRAATLMHTTVYQVRKILKGVGFKHPVKLVNDQYILNVDVRSDIDQLRDLLKSDVCTSESIKKAISLYHGDYMEEENYLWAQSEKEGIKSAFIQYLEEYVVKEAEEDVQLCLITMNRLDPFNEKYVALLMEIYGKTKRIEKMISLFQDTKSKWINELGIDLPLEIVSIYEKYLRRELV